jgi:hypothetical protein
LRLIEELRDIYKEKVSEPSKIVPIDTDYLNTLRSSHYRVITATPYTKKPVMNLRILDQVTTHFSDSTHSAHSLVAIPVLTI